MDRRIAGGLPRRIGQLLLVENPGAQRDDAEYSETGGATRQTHQRLTAPVSAPARSFHFCTAMFNVVCAGPPALVTVRVTVNVRVLPGWPWL